MHPSSQFLLTFSLSIYLCKRYLYRLSFWSSLVGVWASRRRNWINSDYFNSGYLNLPLYSFVSTQMSILTVLVPSTSLLKEVAWQGSTVFWGGGSHAGFMFAVSVFEFLGQTYVSLLVFSTFRGHRGLIDYPALVTSPRHRAIFLLWFLTVASRGDFSLTAIFLPQHFWVVLCYITAHVR